LTGSTAALARGWRGAASCRRPRGQRRPYHQNPTSRLSQSNGREWPRNRLYGARRKCLRHKPRQRGDNSARVKSTSYVISNASFVAERDGFEPEISLAVLTRTQSETPVPVPSPQRGSPPFELPASLSERVTEHSDDTNCRCLEPEDARADFLVGARWIRTRDMHRRTAYHAARDSRTTKSATVILAQETGARSPCAGPDAEPFRIAERPVSIRSPPLVTNAEFSPQPREVVGAHRILGTLLR
jgi:hypothetical protein